MITSACSSTDHFKITHPALIPSLSLVADLRGSLCIVSQFYAKNTSPASSQSLKLTQEIMGNDAKENWSFEGRPLQRATEPLSWASGSYSPQQGPAGPPAAPCPGTCPPDRTSPPGHMHLELRNATSLPPHTHQAPAAAPHSHPQAMSSYVICRVTVPYLLLQHFDLGLFQSGADNTPKYQALKREK